MASLTLDEKTAYERDGYVIPAFRLAPERVADLVAELDRVIAANPDRLDVREKLARVYGGMGEDEKVLETLKEIVEIDPQNVQTLKQISGIYLQKGLESIGVRGS